jgi:hypothetical protein
VSVVDAQQRELLRLQKQLSPQIMARLLELRGWTLDAMLRLGLGFDGRRVVFPVYDAAGDLVGFTRYQPNALLRDDDEPKMRADRGTTRELFPPPEMIHDGEVVDGLLALVEGEPDEIRLWSLGIAAVGVPGAQNWRDEWAPRFSGRCWKVVVCFDCDEAGRTNAIRAATALAKNGVDVRVLDLAPERDDGFDLSDFFASAKTVEERAQAAQLFHSIVAELPLFVPLDEHVATSSRDFVPTSSPVTSSLVPLPSRGDEVDHLVPDLVPEPHSWLPLDVVSRALRLPEPPQIVELLYPGLNHLVSGESEALKTWLALIATAEELVAGRGVLWVDGDDVGSGALLERLRLLGVDDDAIAARFAYVLPDEPLDDERRRDVLEVVRSRACRLAVLDGFNPLLVLHGLNPDSGTDVETFYRLIDPIRKAPTAVVLSDNVVKAKEARGAWAIGSERKKSKAEVHLGMRALVTFVRGGTGKARIEPDQSRDETGDFRPTNLMERVSRCLEIRGEPASRNQIEDEVEGRAKFIRVAIDRLILEGFASEWDGPRNARLVQLERPFRETDDDMVERLADRARHTLDDPAST